MGTSGRLPIDSETPSIGREHEFQVLLSEALRPRASRWLILGERGMGKTHLMRRIEHNVDGASIFNVRRLANSDGKFTNARGVPMSYRGTLSNRPISLSRHLASTPVNASLIVLEDIDHVLLLDAAEASQILKKRPRAAVFMTASSELIDASWDPILGSSHEIARMTLKSLSLEESRELLGDQLSEIPLGAMGNPRLLIEWATSQIGDTTLDGSESSLATVLGTDGKPLAPGDDAFGRVEVSAKRLSDALMAALAQRPELMHELSPRKFEELVAELYERSGYEVELTRASKDGGVDIYAVQRAPFGSFLTVVDCKRHRSDRPVELGLIKSLYGTVMATDASVGVIATTSYFTKGAKTFQEERKYRLGLQDFVSLKDMLSGIHETPAK